MIGDILQPTHLLFILVIALLVLGPKRLPEVGRSLGRGLRDFRSALSGDEPEDHGEVTTTVDSSPPGPTVQYPPPAAEPVAPSLDYAAPPVESTPPTVDHAPATVDHAPATVDHAPTTVDHAPTTVDHAPTTVDHVEQTHEHAAPAAAPVEHIS